MCLLLIWPAASGHSEARHHPLSVTASHRLVTLHWPGPGWPGPSRPGHWALLTILRMRPAHFHLLIMIRGLQQAGPIFACISMNPCLLGPSPLRRVRPVPGGRGQRLLTPGLTPDVTTQILSTGVTGMR